MHPSEKVTKQLTVRGGGAGANPYGQPDRKISAFFLTTSLMHSTHILEYFALCISKFITQFASANWHTCHYILFMQSIEKAAAEFVSTMGVNLWIYISCCEQN